MGNATIIAYDDYSLLIKTVTDADNKTTSVENDYRLLQARKMKDPNNNYTSVTFNAIGLVTEMCLMGKDLGNNAFQGDVPGNPTVAYLYELHNWTAHHLPNHARVFMREKHKAENPTQWADVNLNTPGQNSGWIESITYTGGLGNELMTKMQAEEGLALELDNNEPQRNLFRQCPLGSKQPGDTQQQGQSGMAV